MRSANVSTKSMCHPGQSGGDFAIFIANESPINFRRPVFQLSASMVNQIVCLFLCAGECRCCFNGQPIDENMARPQHLPNPGYRVFAGSLLFYLSHVVVTAKPNTGRHLHISVWPVMALVRSNVRQQQYHRVSRHAQSGTNRACLSNSACACRGLGRVGPETWH